MEKRTLAKQYNRALVVPETLNNDAREVDVTFATESPVFRWGWDEDYNEVLSCEPSSVRMGRIEKGLPVIDGHSGSSIFGQLGRTTKVWFDNEKDSKKVCARIKFSVGEQFDALLANIRNGIIRDVSVGYRVYKFVRNHPETKDDLPTYRATDWEPHEISFVTVPADANSGVRGDNDKNEVQIIKNKSINFKNRKMNEVICPVCGHTWEVSEAETYTCPECGHEFAALAGGEDAAEAVIETEDAAENRSSGGNKRNGSAKPTTGKPADIAAIRAKATENEQTRLNAILVSSRAAKLPDGYAIELYQSKNSVEKCRQLIIEKVADQPTPKVDGWHRADVGEGAIEKKRAAAQNALLSRALPGKFKIEQGNYFRGMTLVEIVKEFAEERGLSFRGKTKSEIADKLFSRAHSTNDFPILFEDSINKILRTEYTLVPEVWDQIARETSVSDFREKGLYQLYDHGGMTKTPEGGEIKYTTLKESKQRIFVEKYARGIRFTREAFINDDLDALQRVPLYFVRGWDELRGDVVWGLILKNVKMDDGKSLFSADHNNLMTGADSELSEASLEKADLLFRMQKDLSGKVIRVQPKMLVVPPQLKLKAQKLMTAIQPTTTGDVNVLSGAYEILVEPRLVGAPAEWYLMAGPNEIDSLYYAYLEGNAGLRVFSEENFNRDTMDYAVRAEFGAAAVDYRGLVKMAGA